MHSTPDPRTARFRLDSPKICARCHTDEKKMARYGLSTAVLRTYVADFHGSTVTLFQKTHPDQETNKPVCYDCHGVHDIPHADDPQKGLRVKDNLLRTCRRCHPDATAAFPDAWMSHFVPDPKRTPLVYWVERFYVVLIPVTIGAHAPVRGRRLRAAPDRQAHRPVGARGGERRPDEQGEPPTR